jgi:hypothetical protein
MYQPTHIDAGQLLCCAEKDVGVQWVEGSRFGLTAK